MTTLIAAYGSEGCEGRCDAKCYNATGPDCDCICGGRNHGVGLPKAVDNTRELAESWVEAWEKEHGQQKEWSIPARAPVQRSFEEATTEEVAV